MRDLVEGTVDGHMFRRGKTTDLDKRGTVYYLVYDGAVFFLSFCSMTLT